MQDVVDEYVLFLKEKINKSKHKLLEMDYATFLLRDKYKDKYDYNKGIEAKSLLLDKEDYDFFAEGTHIDDNKFYYSSGSWIAEKNKYENVIKMKKSIGIQLWEIMHGDKVVDKSL